MLPACRGQCGYTIVIDVADVLAALDAFVGAATYESLCPCGPCICVAPAGGGSSMGPEGGGQCCTISLTADAGSVSPGGTVDVHAFVTEPTDLRGVQAAVSITGGRGGTLTVEALSINEQHIAFVFLGEEYVSTLDTTGGRLMAGMYDGGVNVGAQSKYTGTFRLRASSNARGTFFVNPRTDTMFRDTVNEPIPWSSAGTLSITIE
jgi:hypothetical protein